MAANDMSGAATRLRRPGEGARRSGASALFWILIAGAAAVGGAMLVSSYVDQQRHGTPSTKIVVAALDLPIATTLREDHLKFAEWPSSSLPNGAFLDAKKAVGRAVMTRTIEGEPILEGKLASRDKGAGLAALIPSSMRAVAVRVDDVVGVAGFIHPDDRVDVIVTIRPTKPEGAEPMSKVILQNVKVLAVGKELEIKNSARGQAVPVTVATLLVDPEQSERLALAATNGQILLTLRGWTDDDAIPTAGMFPSKLLADAGLEVPRDAPKATRKPTRREPGAPQAAPVPVAEAEPKKDVVEILRGDRFERRKFDQKDKESAKEATP